MRYDNFLRAIGQARAKYEGTIRTLILSVSKQDVSVDGAIRKLVKKRQPRKKLHWTQRPENKAKVRRQMKNAAKAKRVQNGKA